MNPGKGPPTRTTRTQNIYEPGNSCSQRDPSHVTPAKIERSNRYTIKVMQRPTTCSLLIDNARTCMAYAKAALGGKLKLPHVAKYFQEQTLGYSQVGMLRHVTLSDFLPLGLLLARYVPNR